MPGCQHPSPAAAGRQGRPSHHPHQHRLCPMQPLAGWQRCCCRRHKLWRRLRRSMTACAAAAPAGRVSSPHCCTFCSCQAQLLAIRPVHTAAAAAAGPAVHPDDGGRRQQQHPRTILVAQGPACCCQASCQWLHRQPACLTCTFSAATAAAAASASAHAQPCKQQQRFSTASTGHWQCPATCTSSRPAESSADMAPSVPWYTVCLAGPFGCKHMPSALKPAHLLTRGLWWNC